MLRNIWIAGMCALQLIVAPQAMSFELEPRNDTEEVTHYLCETHKDSIRWLTSISSILSDPDPDAALRKILEAIPPKKVRCGVPKDIALILIKIVVKESPSQAHARLGFGQQFTVTCDALSFDKKSQRIFITVTRKLYPNVEG